MKRATDYVGIPEPEDIFHRLAEDFILEQAKIDGTQATINLTIAKIREYNRLWNQISELRPELKRDGFKILFKDVCIQSDMPEAMQRAAAYL